MPTDFRTCEGMPNPMLSDEEVDALYLNDAQVNALLKSAFPQWRAEPAERERQIYRLARANARDVWMRKAARIADAQREGMNDVAAAGVTAAVGAILRATGSE